MGKKHNIRIFLSEKYQVRISPSFIMNYCTRWEGAFVACTCKLNICIGGMLESQTYSLICYHQFNLLDELVQKILKHNWICIVWSPIGIFRYIYVDWASLMRSGGHLSGGNFGPPNLSYLYQEGLERPIRHTNKNQSSSF